MLRRPPATAPSWAGCAKAPRHPSNSSARFPAKRRWRRSLSDAQSAWAAPLLGGSYSFRSLARRRRFARARFPYGESALPATTCALLPVASAIPAAACASNKAAPFSAYIRLTSLAAAVPITNWAVLMPTTQYELNIKPAKLNASLGYITFAFGWPGYSLPTH
jgi:hypothetical protein